MPAISPRMPAIAMISGFFGDEGLFGTTALERIRLSACWMPCWTEVSFIRPRKRRSGHVPDGKGHMVLYALKPFWRWQTQGSYFLGFNAILNWDHLGAGASDPRMAGTNGL